MYNENNNKFRWIAVFTAIVLLFAGVISSLVIAIGNKPVGEVKKADISGNIDTETPDFDNAEFAPVALKMSKEFTVHTAENGQQSISKTITATVMPATAKNTSVDWSVEWGGNQAGAVTDYVTVTPASDGSTTATVTCKKPFTGEIVIVCTTREGGYMATCTVTFAGHPFPK